MIINIIVFSLVGVGVLFALIRLIAGPTAFDRVVGLDTLNIIITATVVLLALVLKIEQSGKEAFLIGPIQIPGSDMASALSRKLRFGFISETEALSALRRPRAEFDNQFGIAIEFLAQNMGDKFALPHTLLCEYQNCYFGRIRNMFFADSGHLSESGSLLLAPLFEALLER